VFGGAPPTKEAEMIELIDCLAIVGALCVAVLICHGVGKGFVWMRDKILERILGL
jgi:hypothetical protein